MLIIDRFEGDYAVVETAKGLVSIPRTDIPEGAHEGDALVLRVDKEGTAQRKARIDGMMNKLFKD